MSLGNAEGEPSPFSSETEQFIFDSAVCLMETTSLGGQPSPAQVIRLVEQLVSLRPGPKDNYTPDQLRDRFAREGAEQLARKALGLPLRMGQNEIPLSTHNQLAMEAARTGYATGIRELLQLIPPY